MAELYDDLVAAGCKVDSHESDLYVEDTPAARGTARLHQASGKPFRNQIDGKTWLDVPFRFAPWWRARAPK